MVIDYIGFIFEVSRFVYLRYYLLPFSLLHWRLDLREFSVYALFDASSLITVCRRPCHCLRLIPYGHYFHLRLHAVYACRFYACLACFVES